MCGGAATVTLDTEDLELFIVLGAITGAPLSVADSALRLAF